MTTAAPASPASTPRPLTAIASSIGIIVAVLSSADRAAHGRPAERLDPRGGALVRQLVAPAPHGRLATDSNPTTAVGLAGISFISRAWLTAIILFVIALQLRRADRPDGRRRLPGRVHLRPRRPDRPLRHQPAEREVTRPGEPAESLALVAPLGPRPAAGAPSLPRPRRRRTSTPRSSSRRAPTSRSSSGRSTSRSPRPSSTCSSPRRSASGSASSRSGAA